jgi:hypothetical protein
MFIAWLMVSGCLRRPRGGGSSILTQILPGGGDFYPDAWGLRGTCAGALVLFVPDHRALFSEQALSEALGHADMAGPAGIHSSDGRCVRHLGFTH